MFVPQGQPLSPGPLAGDKQVDAGDGQHNDEQDDGRRRGVRGIAAAVAVEHVVDIAHNGVHPRGVQIRAEKGHRVAVGLESADKAGDHQVDDHGGDHGQGDAGKECRMREVPSTLAAL